MKRKKIQKKGALMTKMLVSLIILIIGFAILFYFFVMFDWTGRVDKEVCHQSVIYRATLPNFAGINEYVPLKCKTSKICITSGLLGGECDEFENEKGVGKVKVNNNEDIERFISREIVDCWKTMGEGKVQIFGNFLAEKYGIGGVGSSCVICNRIAFDGERLEKAGINFEEINIEQYMRTHAISDKDISYYNYLAGQGGKVAIDRGGVEVISLEGLSEKEIENNIDESLETLESLEINIEKEDVSVNVEELESPEELNKKSDELSIMFMQVTAPKAGDVLKNTLGAGLSFLGLSAIYKPGAFIGTTAVKAPITRSALGQFTKGSGKIVTKTGATAFAKIIVIAAVVGLVAQQGNVASNRAITAGYCGDVSTGSNAKDGCSVVRTVNYDLEDISSYCSFIESIN